MALQREEEIDPFVRASRRIESEQIERILETAEHRGHDFAVAHQGRVESVLADRGGVPHPTPLQANAARGRKARCLVPQAGYCMVGLHLTLCGVLDLVDTRPRDVEDCGDVVE